MPDEEIITPEPSFEDFVASRQGGKPSTTEAAEPADSEDADEESPAAETAEESETSEETEAETPGPKKGKGFQKRVDKLTRKNGELAGKVEFLERQIAAQTAKPVEATPAPATAAEGEPKAESFETYEAYVRALTKWEIKQDTLSREKEATARQAADQAKAQSTKWNERVTETKARIDDYDEVLAKATDLQVSQAMNESILTSDHGPDIAYFLASNPAEAKRIFALAPIATAREIGKIEAKFEGRKTPQPKPITSAPAPPRSVGAKGSTTSSLYDEVPFEDFAKKRNAQLYRKP